MDNKDLFTQALQLEYPWKVTKITFLPDESDSKMMCLHITIDFEKGAKFVFYNEDDTLWCDESGHPIEKTAHDTVERTWRHLNFFQYKTFIHTRIPKVSDGKGHCPTVKVPWSRKNSGFTLLFEVWVMELAKYMSVAEISRIVGVYDKRLWNFINHYVNEARELENYSDVTNIGIDETSRKGHNYISVVCDLSKRKVIYATEGKDHTTVNQFVDDFKEHQGVLENVNIITCDMSLGFRKGIQENFPNSHTIIDKFHVIKHANEAVDKVRKDESKKNCCLKNTKYLWLSNEVNLTNKQREWKSSLMKSLKHSKTARAYAIRVELQDIYEQCITIEEAKLRLQKVCKWMMHSRISQMKELCGLIRNHWEEILAYFEYRFTNAVLEGMNCIIQNIKRRARGFRNMQYFKTMIYLSCSKLDIDAVISNA